MQAKQDNELERVSSEEVSESLITEFWTFLRHNKKWWLLPIIAMLIVVTALIWLSGSAAAPFIYTLF